MIQSLSTKNVKYYNVYRKADFEAFTLLFENLSSLKFKISSGEDSIHDVFPTFEKIYWRPDFNFLSDSDSNGRVHAGIMLHQATHCLFGPKFVKELGNPGAALLSETVASAINIYFVFKINSQNLRSEVEFGQENKKFYSLNQSSTRKLRFEYKRFPLDEIGFFRRLCSEIWDFYEMLYRIEVENKFSEISTVRRFKKIIQKLEFPAIAKQVDFANNYLFVKAHYSDLLDQNTFRRGQLYLDDWFDQTCSVGETLSRIATE